ERRLVKPADNQGGARKGSRDLGGERSKDVTMRVTTSGRRWVDKAHRDHAKRQDDDRGRAAPPYAHVDASHQHAYLSPDEASMMRSNAASAHARLFTPELSVKMAQIIERAISMESGGTFVESAGGAHVKSFD